MGVGDPPGMAVTHAIASGMGGMRTAGDLVARMQMTKAMKIKEAKEYVASKLNVPVDQLTDPVVMTEVREELGIGIITPLPGSAIGMGYAARGPTPCGPIRAASVFVCYRGSLETSRDWRMTRVFRPWVQDPVGFGFFLESLLGVDRPPQRENWACAPDWQ